MIETVERLTKLLVSPQIGIARKLHVRENAPIAFGLCSVSAYPANIRGPAGRGEWLLPTCGGSAASKDLASVAALMEFVERYCGIFGPDYRMHVGPALDDSYLWGERLGVFADWQYRAEGFPYLRHAPEAPVRWARGRSLMDGKCRHVPLAWAQVPFYPSFPGERILCSNSSGMAAAFDYDLAIANGILELCERDALMVMWYHRIGMPGIRVDLDELMGEQVASNVYDAGVELKFVDLSNDLGVPVVLCAMKRNWRGTLVHSVGMAARSSLRLACTKAFIEATTESFRQICELKSPTRTWRPAPDFSNVTEVWHHGTLYSHPDYMGELDFLWQAPETRRLDAPPALPAEPSALLRALVAILRAEAMDAVVLPLSTPEIRDAGIKVVKVVVPQLVSFYADHRYPHLGAARIWSAASKLGAQVDPRGRYVTNALPHPFA